MKNAAEIRAEEETRRLLFRPCNELEEGVKRVIRDAYIDGYRAGYERATNINDELIEKTTL